MSRIKQRFGYDVNRERNLKFYQSKQWQNIRLFVLSRDGYICQPCKRRNKLRGANQVHHLKELNTDEGWELRLDADSCEAICDNCHIRETNREIRERKTGIKEPEIYMEMFEIQDEDDEE